MSTRNVEGHRVKRYIVRPSSFHAISAARLGSTTLTARSRAKQLSILGQLRAEDPATQALALWLDEAGDKVRRLSKDHPSKHATGTMVMEMEPNEAEQLRHEVENVTVVQDQPLELIHPHRANAMSKVLDPNRLWHLDEIGLNAARKSGFHGTGVGVTVAVLDTGIEANHSEFAGKSISMVTFDVDSWQTQTSQQSIDTSGHGTHVAGLVAGRTVGVAPGATLINGMMIPNDRGLLSDFVLALEWAASQPEIAIVNMSAGIRGFIEGMGDAIEDLLALGVLPVIATGNEGRNRTRSPGNYNSVLSVGACVNGGGVARFSSSGTYSVSHQIYRVPDLVAPGESVTSCVMGGGYEAWDGTSMATPIVSGVAALILERHPRISMLDLMEVLIESSSDLGVAVERQGAGIVQVAAAELNDLRQLSGLRTNASNSSHGRPTKEKASGKEPAPSAKRRKP